MVVESRSEVLPTQSTACLLLQITQPLSSDELLLPLVRRRMSNLSLGSMENTEVLVRRNSNTTVLAGATLALGHLVRSVNTELCVTWSTSLGERTPSWLGNRSTTVHTTRHVYLQTKEQHDYNITTEAAPRAHHPPVRTLMHTRIFVIMEGGLIQNICATDPDIVDVVVIDYDTDGVDREDLTEVPQKGHHSAKATVERWSPDGIDTEIEDLATAMFGAEQ